MLDHMGTITDPIPFAKLRSIDVYDTIENGLFSHRFDELGIDHEVPPEELFIADGALIVKLQRVESDDSFSHYVYEINNTKPRIQTRLLLFRTRRYD